MHNFNVSCKHSLDNVLNKCYIEYIKLTINVITGTSIGTIYWITTSMDFNMGHLLNQTIKKKVEAMRRAVVLIVDDERSIREMLKLLLSGP
ncbi:MAG: hypothetical protein AAB307_05110, partial [Deltaproteobacteria bacterium]